MREITQTIQVAMIMLLAIWLVMTFAGWFWGLMILLVWAGLMSLCLYLFSRSRHREWIRQSCVNPGHNHSRESRPSSAPIRGRVVTLSGWDDVSPAPTTWPETTARDTSERISLHGDTTDGAFCYEDGPMRMHSTPLRTLPWRTKSGSNKAGVPGPAGSLDESERDA